MRRLLVLLLAAALTQAAPLAITNGDFERVKDDSPDSWTCPEYWSGKVETVTTDVHGGKRAAKLTATEKAGKVWARIHASQITPSFGLSYHFTVWAKGTGELKLGTICYRPKGLEKPQYEYLWLAQPAALSDDWQQVAFDFAVPDPTVYRLALTIQLDGNDAVALVDDAVIEVGREAPGTFSIDQPYAMVRPGDKLELHLKTTADGTKLEGKPVYLSRTVGEATETSELKLNAAGEATYAVEVPADAELGLTQLALAQPTVGGAATAYIEVVDPAEYAKLEAAAKVAKVSAKEHFLFLGDSLSDQRRGHNYTDMVTFWLRKTHGDGITDRNAGVGGDYITRLWLRIQGDPKVYRPTAFDGLMEPAPTRVYIFLGHNDTKLTAGSNYTQAVVSPEDYDQVFKQLIGWLREHSTDPRVTLMSNTSSVYEICKERTDKSIAAGKPGTLFGKPETMEQYNAILQQVATDTNCHWLDVYNPTKNAADKLSLFVPDGVHVSDQGNRLLALLLLEDLGR